MRKGTILFLLFIVCLCSVCLTACSNIVKIYIAKNMIVEVRDGEGLSFKYISDSECIVSGSKFKGTLTSYKQRVYVVDIPETYMGKTVTGIGDGAFYDSDLLVGISIPKSVVNIGINAFYDCDLLSSVAFERDAKIQNIGSQAFFNCGSLQKIDIPASVNDIGLYALDCCESLKSIKVATENTSYKAVGDCLYTKDGKTLIKYANAKTSKTYTILSGVTEIIERAFGGSKNLTTLEIPLSIRKISGSAFDGCSNLNYNEKDDLLYLGNSNQKYIYLKSAINKLRTSYKIDENCLIIGEKAFCNKEELRRIKIPKGVVTISYMAFSGCKNLKTIDFSESNNLEIIEESAFAGCESLRAVELPSNVTLIGEKAFLDCKKIETLEFSPSTLSIGAEAFKNCYKIKAVAIPSGALSIGERAFMDCDEIETVIISATVTTVGQRAFEGCDKLDIIYCEGVRIPEGWHKEWNYYSTTPTGGKLYYKVLKEYNRSN